MFDLLHADGVADQHESNPPRELAHIMHASWVDFISTGAARWAPVTRSITGAQVFDETPMYDVAAYQLDAEIAGVA